MSDIKYYTPEGLEKMREELHLLTTVERPSISRQIAEARDKGDLSENAEYHAAKEEQGHLEAKLSEMEAKLANARVMDDSQVDLSKANKIESSSSSNLYGKISFAISFSSSFTCSINSLFHK